ncbi:site-specific DNA-methyltransferase, partial [Sharpea azabuensis]|uniref:site-specific DNA-methyltransferase n=1 Tax=Sharpea azabuensis TaxID=322505 RepID=UPI002E81BF6D
APVKDLVSPEWNPRQITTEELEKLKTSLEEFGYIEPIIVNDVNNHVVGGNQRLRALIALGYDEVDCVYVHIEDINKEKACNVALNKISGDWDEDKLRVVLEDIELSPIDIKLTGFDELELESFDVITPPNVYEDDFELPSEDEVEVNVTYGQLFKLGNHFLLCGDATNEADVKKLMSSTKCDLFLTDPPYNVNYTDGHDNERKIMNDHWDSDEEAGKNLWKPAFTNARNIANEFCSVYCFMPQGGTHMMMMMMMMMESGWQVKHELIWVKQSLVLGRQDYNYQHEPILYGWGDKHKFYGKGQYATTSVWNFDRPTQSKEHPTMKPLELLGEILLNATVENDVVLDLFGGSGSTLIACEQLNRNCYMMELDPYYCQIIINRWEEYTGRKAEKIGDDT